MRKNMGISSNSHSRKKSRKSRAVNTPMTAVWRMSSQTKYSLTLCLMPHDANTAAMPSSPVSSTRGALRPSTPRKYWTSRDSIGIQSSIRSTSCTPPFDESYRSITTALRASSTSAAAPAKMRTILSPFTKTAMTTATARGRNTTTDSSPVNSVLNRYLRNNTTAKIAMTPIETTMP